MGYKVLSRLRHDGEVYEPGDVVEAITEEQAAPLVRDGVLADEATAKQERQEEQAAEAPAEAPAPAEQEAPANPAPLEDGSSVEEQVKANVEKDLTDSDKLAEQPGQPVEGQPSPSEVAETASQVE